MLHLLHFIPLFLFASLTASPFDNPYNHSNQQEIHWLNLSGERDSGTKFIGTLILANFPSLAKNCPNTGSLNKYGHKHFLPWFDAPVAAPEGIAALNHEESIRHFANSDDCLFLVIVRDPYDWLRSFYQKPYSVHASLQDTFGIFISRTWFSKDNTAPINVDNFNPWTGRPFANVLELRKYKTLNYLNIGNFVKNYLFVRYEDVRDHPQEFIDFIADNYGLQKKDSYTPIDRYVDHKKMGDKPFKKSKYFRMNQRNFQFINTHIDWAVEAKVGFYKKTTEEID